MLRTGLVVDPAHNLPVVPVIDVPVGNFAAGVRRRRKLVAMFSAALLNDDGSTLLFTNGVLKLTAPVALQAAEANVVKSPLSIADVGTKALVLAGSWRVVVP